MSGRQVPDGWERKPIREVAEVVGGTTPPRAQPEYFGGGVPWATPTDITAVTGRYLEQTKESLTEAGFRAAGFRLLPRNSVLVTSRASIGFVALAREPVTTNQGFQSLVPKPGIEPSWLYYAVSAQKPELVRLASGSTFKEFSRESFRALPLLVPPTCEQEGIAHVLDSIDGAIEQTEAVIAATERLRRALLQELLTRGRPKGRGDLKASPIGEIPAHWKLLTVEKLASREPRSIQSGPFGSELKHSEFRESGVLVIGIDSSDWPLLDGHPASHIGREVQRASGS